MAAYTTLRSTFGRLPDDDDDDRFVDAWAKLVADAIENAASRRTRDDRRDRASRSRRWLLAQPGRAGRVRRRT